MDLTSLPPTTRLEKPILVHKTQLKEHCDASGRRALKDDVSRVFWTHKLSQATIGMAPGKFEELQIFELRLKRKAAISELLLQIQRSVPYYLLVLVRYKEEGFLATAIKDPKVGDRDAAVVRASLQGPWRTWGKELPPFNLKASSLDDFHTHVCQELGGMGQLPQMSQEELRSALGQRDACKRQIQKLEAAYNKTSNRSRKVELHHQILGVQAELRALEDRLQNQIP